MRTGSKAGGKAAARLYENCMESIGYRKLFNDETYGYSTQAPVSEIYTVSNTGGFTKRDFRKVTDSTTGETYYEINLNNSWQRSSLNEFLYERRVEEIPERHRETSRPMHIRKRMTADRGSDRPAVCPVG